MSLKSVKSNCLLPEAHQTCWGSQGVMPYKIITHCHHHTGNRKPNYIKCDLWLDFVFWCRKKVTLSLYTIVSKCTHILREMIFYFLHTWYCNCGIFCIVFPFLIKILFWYKIHVIVTPVYNGIMISEVYAQIIKQIKYEFRFVKYLLANPGFRRKIQRLTAIIPTDTQSPKAFM